MLKPAFAPAIAGRCLRREFMNNLIWRSVTCRPGKKSVLPKGKADPCSRRRYRQTRPEGRSPPLRGCLRSGYALPSTAPQRHSHPDCRAVLTLIVAQQVNEKRLRPHSAGSTLPHLWPTCSSSGWPPLTAARYFSSCPSDSGSLRTPCPPGYSSNRGFRSALAVSGFRLRARLSFSIPLCSPGQRGITPAFGYGAPHPSAEGPSTPL